MNKGEEAEIFLKAMLLKLKDSNKAHPILGRIRNLSDDNGLESLRWKPECQKFFDSMNFEKLQHCLGLKKSSNQSKADITINRINYSVKLEDLRPSIINHTTRPGFERICNSLKIQIDTLDRIIEKYWEKRRRGTITEDIANNDSRSPFRSHKEYLRQIINYFIFVGSGSRDSKYIANRVLVINYQSMQNGIRIIDRDQYFDEVWPNLVLAYEEAANQREACQKNIRTAKTATALENGRALLQTVTRGRSAYA